MFCSTANSERQLSEKVVRHQSAAHPNGTLVLSSLDINDMGQYMCEANNGVEPSLKKTITVRVNEVPEIRPFAFPPNLRVGEKALLTCHVTSGSQPITFSWLKDGNTMAANQGIRLRSESEYSVMLMESVQPTHVGNYTCIAKNKHGFDSFTAVLEVESPPSWKKKPEDLRVNIGDRAVIYCLATGSPTPKIKWKRQRKPNEKGARQQYHFP
ncbi:cell adhesion molecule, putative, partial [Ixodes scapularis]